MKIECKDQRQKEIHAPPGPRVSLRIEKVNHTEIIQKKHFQSCLFRINNISQYPWTLGTKIADQSSSSAGASTDARDMCAVFSSKE